MFHNLFSIVLFIQISQSVIVLAITIVSMIVGEFNVTILVGKIFYVGILLSEIGLFCYLGDQVCDEVMQITNI